MRAVGHIIRGPVGDVVKGQLGLLGGLAVCVALRPEGLGVNHGVSYYGIHRETFPWLAAALLTAALFTRRALRSAAPATPAPRPVRRLADAFTVLVAGVVFTPYTLGPVIGWVHRACGAALYLLQLLLGWWLVAWARRDALAVGCLLFQLGGGIVAAVYVVQDEGLLLHGEVTFQIGFALLLIRALPLVTAARPRAGAAAAPGPDPAETRPSRPPVTGCRAPGGDRDRPPGRAAP